jgi:uncharacterized protein (DUF1810 family)
MEDINQRLIDGVRSTEAHRRQSATLKSVKAIEAVTTPKRRIG